MKRKSMKRGQLEIIYEILSICREPAYKTRVLYKCNLSHEQLMRYLNYLMNRSLLCTVEGSQKKLFQITEKGRKFIEGYENLNGIMGKTVYNVSREPGNQ